MEVSSVKGVRIGERDRSIAMRTLPLAEGSKKERAVATAIKACCTSFDLSCTTHLSSLHPHIRLTYSNLYP